MPYNTGYEFIEVWMKNYYELPQDICFVWNNLEDSIQWYFISGDYYNDNWLGKKAVFGVKADEKRDLKITVMNPGNIEGQQLLCTIEGKESVFDVPGGKTSVFDIVIPAGTKEVTLQAAQIFIPDNGDPRELSVIVDFEIF